MSSGPDGCDRPVGSAWTRLLAATMLGLCLLLASACQENPGNVKGRPAAVEAPPRVSQSRHQYRYFPESAVYMDTARRLFFYRKGEKWLATTILPANVEVDWKNYVPLELDTDKPYLLHSEIVKKYPRKSTSRALP
jgi:hypothetical protein